MASCCGVGRPKMTASVEPSPPYLISPNTAEAASVLAHMSGRVSYSGYYLPSPPSTASPAPAGGSPWVGPCHHTPQSAATNSCSYQPRELFERPTHVGPKPTGNVLCREETLQSVRKPCALPAFYSSPPPSSSASPLPLDQSAGFSCFHPRQLYYGSPFAASPSYSPVFAQPQQPIWDGATTPHYGYNNSYSQQPQWAKFYKPTVLTDKELLQTIVRIVVPKHTSATTTSPQNSRGLKRTRESPHDDDDGGAHASSSKLRRKCDVTETDPNRPYRCDFCKKSFRQQSTLTTHRRIHTGERPYSCAYCDRRFGDYSTKVKHQRTHTGSKPYDCFVCHVRFSQSGNMLRHLETVHGIDRKLVK